jgi:hypothetical protein
MPHLSSLTHSSWESLPQKSRYRVMMLLPFLSDPYAKVLTLREISRSKKDYDMICSLPNSAEVIWDIFNKDLKWLTAHPKEFAFQKITSKGWEFSPPDARFSDITFGQWCEMEIAFNRYLRTQKETAFDKVLSHIYTTHKQGSKCDKLTAISLIPYPFRLDAFRMYVMIREKVLTSYRHIFPKVRSVSENKKSKSVDFRSIPDNTDMWHSLLFSLAETPAFQGMKTAFSANMWEALTYLDEKAFQAAKAREEATKPIFKKGAE